MTISSANFMIYGATGYTAGLIIQEAKTRGYTPILAGRDHHRLIALGRQHALPVRVFDLASDAEVGRHLQGTQVVLHCAGPFVETFEPMLEGCMRTGAHYLDITGEISVFEAIRARDQGIKDAGIVAIPGVGFDVVPTDCLAVRLAEKLPTASSLALAFAPSGSFGMSPGTARTMVTQAHKGGAIRQDGRITKVPLAYKKRRISFRDGERLCVTIPWGDVSTAFHSTGIPNIEVYISTTKKQLRSMAWSNPFLSFMRIPALRNLIRDQVGKKMAGPDAKARAAGTMQLWGEVTTEDGRKAEATMTTPEGYHLTMLSALAAVEKVTQIASCGALTPSRAFGADFAESLPGVSLRYGDQP